MRNFLKLVHIRFRYFSRNWVILVCLFISICASLLYGIVGSKNRVVEDVFEIAVINEDNGELSTLMIEKIFALENVNTEIMDRRKATLQLSLGRIDGIFIINDDFSRKLKRGEYKDTITMISPITLSSSAPISDYISTQTMYIWLREITEDKLKHFYRESDKKDKISLETIIESNKQLEDSKAIINIEYIDLTSQSTKMESEDNPNESSVLNKVVGVFACFSFFAIAYSSEWIFNLKKQALILRLDQMNISITSVSLASLLACILFCTIAYATFITIAFFIFGFPLIEGLISICNVFIYFVAVGSLSFTVTILVLDTNQFLILTSTIGILNLSLSQLLAPLPEWAKLTKTLSFVLPGSQLAYSLGNPKNILFGIGFSAIWLFFAWITLVMTYKIQNRQNVRLYDRYNKISQKT